MKTKTMIVIAALVSTLAIGCKSNWGDAKDAAKEAGEAAKDAAASAAEAAKDAAGEVRDKVAK